MARSHSISETGLTELLVRWNDGDEAALDALTPMVYRELRSLARHYMRGEQAGHTLQPTALVHELFVRLFDNKDPRWQNRGHFLGVAARMMRRILVDHARRKNAQKRQTPDPATPSYGLTQEEILSLDEALGKLERIDPRKAAVVEHKYFAGMTGAETAQALNISEASVDRDWTLAKAWLYRELQSLPSA